MSRFAELFGVEPEGVWAAPGRVTVIGEHTDYTGGLVLPVALPHTCRAALARRADGRLVVASVQHPDDIADLTLADLTPGTPAGWAGYPAGVVHALREQVVVAGGLSILVDGEVPAGAGLSSSASLSCSVVLAVAELLDLGLARAELVDVARRAENDFVGAPTGVLDQSASLLCTEGAALFLDTRDRSTSQVPLDLAAAGLVLLVVDTGVTHSHADGGYGDRRAELERATELLGLTWLRDATPADVDGLAEDVLRRRARHVVTENARVAEVVEILRSGADPRAIGPVMTAGHISLRDDFEISVPELDAVVDTALALGAYGARMVGGGFGGSAVVLVDADRRDDVAEGCTAALQAMGARPRVFDVVPSPGARRLS